MAIANAKRANGQRAKERSVAARQSEEHKKLLALASPSKDPTRSHSVLPVEAGQADASPRDVGNYWGRQPTARSQANAAMSARVVIGSTELPFIGARLCQFGARGDDDQSGVAKGAGRR